LKRELLPKRLLTSGSTVAIFLAIALMGMFAPISAPAQALRKEPGAKSVLATSATQGAVSGKELFRQHCASCHFAETTAQKIGPGLKGLYTRLTFSDGRKVTDGSLMKWIEAGGKNMPGFKDDIKPEQIRALISYVKTL
jgi:mono/diheme cytochrome c family protein